MLRGGYAAEAGARALQTCMEMTLPQEAEVELNQVIKSLGSGGKDISGKRQVVHLYRLRCINDDHQLYGKHHGRLQGVGVWTRVGWKARADVTLKIRSPSQWSVMARDTDGGSRLNQDDFYIAGGAFLGATAD